MPDKSLAKLGFAYIAIEVASYSGACVLFEVSFEVSL